MQRFLDLADLSRDEVVDLLALAQRLQDRPEPQALAGKILGLLFLNPSLRTLASFQAGMQRLGGTAFVITPGAGTWKLETRDGAVMNGAAAEHVREAIPVLASYCDALGIRAFAEGKDLAADLAEDQFMRMAGLCPKPLINLESAINHPCQALADWKTMDDLGVPRARQVRAVAGCTIRARCRSPCRPRPCTWRRSAAWKSSCCGPRATRCRPPIMDKARAGGRGVGRRGQRDHATAPPRCRARTCSTPRNGARRSTTATPRPRPGLRAPLADWCVRESWFRHAAAGLPFHALPAGAPQRRGRRRSARRRRAAA